MEDMISKYTYGISKRVLDICVTVSAVTLLLPVWVAVVVIIVISDPGPLLHRQERVGCNGRSFLIYKFRTMRTDNVNQSTVTIAEDPRVYRSGYLLRRWKIDELPQFFNVLNGSMSLVGPRPTVCEDYQRMTEREKRRSKIRPGITGLAQISGNTELPWKQRIELDIEYMENASLWLDLKILMKTTLLIISGRAETHPKTGDEWEEE